MDFMSLRLNSSSLTCSICALAAIILQLIAMERQNLHMVDSPIHYFKAIKFKVAKSLTFVLIHVR